MRAKQHIRRGVNANAEFIRGLTVRTMDETANILGITQQRVQQIEANAMKKLRAKLMPYKDFFARR